MYHSLLLGFYQLIIHVFCLIVIETILFYTIIKPNINKVLNRKLNSYKKKIWENNSFTELDKLKKKASDVSVLTSSIYGDMHKKFSFLDNYIEIYNKYILYTVIIILLSIFTVGSITYFITGTFTYNIVTTVSSMAVSLILQIIYIFEYNINNPNPIFQDIVTNTIKEEMVTMLNKN